ncbi:MAG: dipeptidase [Firmicutes bacterium]|nr:dipeptidase [Bacillota bacterium]
MKTGCIDMHCDTLMKAYFDHHEDLFERPGQVDFKRMKEAGAMAQFFAIYMPSPESLPEMGLSGEFTDDGYIEGCSRIFETSLKAHPDVAAKACTAADIRANWSKGLTSAVLTMEDGRAVGGKFDNIKAYYDLGVRALSLTWNFENCFGFPNSDDLVDMMKGLKPFGKEAIQYMQELGMLVDVSHLSDGGFYDVASICTKPFVATHSNARSLSPHRRNLKDDQLRLLAKAGGVTGLNVCPAFLNADIKDKNSRISEMAKHVRYIADLAGTDTIAMGSDFDGTTGIFEMEDCTQLYKLADALKKQGFTEAELDKFFSGNVLRVMDEAVK